MPTGIRQVCMDEWERMMKFLDTVFRLWQLRVASSLQSTGTHNEEGVRDEGDRIKKVVSFFFLFKKSYLIRPDASRASQPLLLLCSLPQPHLHLPSSCSQFLQHSACQIFFRVWPSFNCFLPWLTCPALRLFEWQQQQFKTPAPWAPALLLTASAHFAFQLSPFSMLQSLLLHACGLCPWISAHVSDVLASVKLPGSNP